MNFLSSFVCPHLWGQIFIVFVHVSIPDVFSANQWRVMGSSVPTAQFVETSVRFQWMFCFHLHYLSKVMGQSGFSNEYFYQEGLIKLIKIDSKDFFTFILSIPQRVLKQMLHSF